MEDFKEFLYEHIKGSGISWNYAAVKLGVKYDTLLKWKSGKHKPPMFVQDVIIEKINSWSIPTE